MASQSFQAPVRIGEHEKNLEQAAVEFGRAVEPLIRAGNALLKKLDAEAERAKPQPKKGEGKK